MRRSAATPKGSTAWSTCRVRGGCRLNEAERQAFAALVFKGPDPATDGISAYPLDELCDIAKTRDDVACSPRGMSCRSYVGTAHALACPVPTSAKGVDAEFGVWDCDYITS